MKWLPYQSSQQRWSQYWLPSTYMVPVRPGWYQWCPWPMDPKLKTYKHLPVFCLGVHLTVKKEFRAQIGWNKWGGGRSTNSSTWSMTKPGVYVGNSWAPKSQLWLFQNSFCRNYTRKQTWVTCYKEALNWNGFEVGSTSFQKYVHKNCRCISYDVYCMLRMQNIYIYIDTHMKCDKETISSAKCVQNLLDQQTN